jgi:hypothetical protein
LLQVFLQFGMEEIEEVSGICCLPCRPSSHHALYNQWLPYVFTSPQQRSCKFQQLQHPPFPQSLIALLAHYTIFSQRPPTYHITMALLALPPEVRQRKINYLLPVLNVQEGTIHVCPCFDRHIQAMGPITPPDPNVG